MCSISAMVEASIMSVLKMSRSSTATVVVAATMSAIAIATFCSRPSAAFLSHCHVLPARNRHPARDTAALGVGVLSHTQRRRTRSGSPSSGDGVSGACLESRPTSTSFAFRTRHRRVLRMSFDTGGGEDNALLLRMDFEHAEVEELRRWIRRYPFGTALPVQPFSLVETDTGVDVVFRKKPTLERGSQDGGLCFTVEDAVEDAASTEAGREGHVPTGPTLVMRRISKGQEIRKMFAERIVVKAVVKALAGSSAPPGTKLRTVLHEGLI